MGRVFAVEAWLSLILAALLFVFGRLRLRGSGVAAAGPVFGARSILLAGTVGCTLVGYFAIQPLLPGARAGQGPWSFGMLHAASSAFFALKMILVVVLAWRASGG